MLTLMYVSRRKRSSIVVQYVTTFVGLSANQATEFILTLPANVSGQTFVYLEAQTTDSIELTVDQAASSIRFLLDSFAPVVMTTSPLVDSYLNVNQNRT